MDSERTHLVVVAEDDPLLRLDARLSLEEAGFTVIEAGDAPTALTAIEENAEVEALFTDVQMPGAFGGLDLAHRARAMRPQLAVFVASGEVPVQACDMPRPSRFFAKPYEMAQVAEAMRAAVA